MSVFSVLFIIVLFSGLNSHSVTVAKLSTKAEDVSTDQEGLDSILGDETMAESLLVPTMYRQSMMLDSNMKEDRAPKVIIISVSKKKIYIYSTYILVLVNLLFRFISFVPTSISIDKSVQSSKLNIMIKILCKP